MVKEKCNFVPPLDKKNIMETIRLSNGTEMPISGFGVWRISPEECQRCVTDALSVGYRSIDTAQIYRNEEGVGLAVAKSGIARHELFITTKVWITNAGEQRAARSIDESLRKLRTDYVDLLLVHQPFGDYYGTYRAMERALSQGKARAIGVSNFAPDRFVDMAENVDVVPMVNQIRTNVFCQQHEAEQTMLHYGAKITAWAPLAKAADYLLTDPLLNVIAAKHGKTVAQVALRYLVQRGIAVIPKSTHIERMRENYAIFDFELSHDEMRALLMLDRPADCCAMHRDPAEVRRIIHL